MSSLRCKLYRALARFVKRVFRREASDATFPVAEIWIHAASAGEAEALVPLVERSKKEGKRVLFTCFSSSGLRVVESFGGRLSPFEGEWEAALQQVRPHAFVTYKYEWWPELLGALAATKIPLWVLSADVRSSAFWGVRGARFLGAQLPKLYLGTVHQAGKTRLEEWCQEWKISAEIRIIKDTRWDRLRMRAEQMPSARVKSLFQEWQKYPRPWRMLAQVWSSDLPLFESTSEVEGTFFLVPHKLQGRDVETLQAWVSANRHRVWVGEEGVLFELYSVMDWVYVGGGFEAGVHSTMEPGFWGIPVVCGPKNAKRFPEIEQLESEGLLKIVNDAVSFREALLNPPQRRERRKQGADGDTPVEEVLTWIREELLIASTPSHVP